MDDKRKENNRVSRSLDVIENETLMLQRCLNDITAVRISLECNLDSSTKELFDLVEKQHELESVNARYSNKIQDLEEEANLLEKEQVSLIENIRNFDFKIHQCKENADIKIENFVRESENLCELYLSAVNIEPPETESLKVSDEIKRLQLEIAEKENAIMNIKQELEEFILYDSPEDLAELAVPMEHRELIMNLMENQYLDVKQQYEDLKSIKYDLQLEKQE